MPPGFAISPPPPVPPEEIRARLESGLAELSDLALPVRMLKDTETLMADWLTAERSAVNRSPAPALYRAVETLHRLTAIRKTLTALAQSLLRRDSSPENHPGKPAGTHSPSVFPSTFPSALAPTPASALPLPPGATAPTPAVPASPAPEPSPRSALSTPQSSGGPQSPTPPKRGPLRRSSAEIVQQVRSCPRLATLHTKILERNINGFVRLKAAMAYVRPVPRPGQPTPAPSREHLAAQGFSFHPMPPNQVTAPSQAAPPLAAPPSTADPPDSG